MELWSSNFTNAEPATFYEQELEVFPPRFACNFQSYKKLYRQKYWRLLKLSNQNFIGSSRTMPPR